METPVRAGVDVAIVERRTSQDLAGSRAGGLHSRTIEVFDQRGIVLGSEFRRYSGRVNIDRTLTDRLQVGTNLTISNIDEQQQPTDNGLANGAVMSALWFNPIIAPKDDALVVLKAGEIRHVVEYLSTLK